MSFAVVDTVLTGHASAVDLATLGLGLSVYSTVFVGLMGAVSALNPVIAQHFGADRHAAIGASYGQGLWMALLLSVTSTSSAPSSVHLNTIRHWSLTRTLWKPAVASPDRVQPRHSIDGSTGFRGHRDR